MVLWQQLLSSLVMCANTFYGHDRELGFSLTLLDAGSLAIRLYGKGDYGVLQKEDVIQRIQRGVQQHTDFS